MALAVTSPALVRLLEAVGKRAHAAGVFGGVKVVAGRLTCLCKASPEPAEFRVDVQGGGEGQVCVSLVTPHRYLSQSIEQDLVHQGDKLDDLLKDELVDQEYAGPALRVEHFRSPPPDMLYTFRTLVGIDAAAAEGADAVERVVQVLLAYDACFSPLGDLSAGGE
ncbi:MAG: hypothetical protein ACKVS8_11600 [Phycisphaerales bacterium]